MNSTLSNLFIFVTGATIGSLVTWQLLKKKYEKLAQEEIDSVYAAFSTHADNEAAEDDTPEYSNDISENPEPEVAEAPTQKDIYEKIVKNLGYTRYSSVDTPTQPQKEVSEEEVSNVGGPRVITPDEFIELDYKIVELTYWADGVLTDNKNKRIQDVDALLGKGTIEQFGKYEDDCLHVRDDEKEISFEILRDLKRYSDFFDDSPHQAEDE